MNQKEFENAIKIKANLRYEYFIKTIADYEELWGLYYDGWAITIDDQGNNMLPLWPKKSSLNFAPKMNGVITDLRE